ncbi:MULTISPECIES: hypothetical protein [unclassified Serratia (in: enterobacteria)]|jgi:hypothetical protein|nr:hypothetical protein [Serratia sp. C2(2)]MEE4446283.1 hypothetical protein [Serratia sp. C2(1)]
MEDIETIRSVISLDFTPEECIADSVNMGNMFPALNQPQIDEVGINGQQ